MSRHPAALDPWRQADMCVQGRHNACPVLRTPATSHVRVLRGYLRALQPGSHISYHHAFHIVLGEGTKYLPERSVIHS